jgi:hypothetical protein
MVGEAGANIEPPVRICGTRHRLEGESCGIPHLAKNERDMGHPAFGDGIEPEGAWIRLTRDIRKGGLLSSHIFGFEFSPSCV